MYLSRLLSPLTIGTCLSIYLYIVGGYNRYGIGGYCMDSIFVGRAVFGFDHTYICIAFRGARLTSVVLRFHWRCLRVGFAVTPVGFWIGSKCRMRGRVYTYV